MRSIHALLWLLLLLLVACKSAPPPAEEKPAERAMRVSVTTAPAQPRMDKPFTVRVQVFNTEGGPVTGAKLSGLLTMKEMNHGSTEFEFTEKGHGVYEAISKVEMSGDWTLKLNAEHAGDRMQQDFPVVVGD